MRPFGTVPDYLRPDPVWDVNAGQDPLLCDGEDADSVLSVHAAAARRVAS